MKSSQFGCFGFAFVSVESFFDNKINVHQTSALKDFSQLLFLAPDFSSTNDTWRVSVTHLGTNSVAGYAIFVVTEILDHSELRCWGQLRNKAFNEADEKLQPEI